jgi:hypothetical protein
MLSRACVVIEAHPALARTGLCYNGKPCRVPERSGAAALFMHGLRAFIENFFMCEECRDHFVQQLNKPAASAVATKEQAVEWLWRTHNAVNARLAAVRPSPSHTQNAVNARLAAV